MSNINGSRAARLSYVKLHNVDMAPISRLRQLSVLLIILVRELIEMLPMVLPMLVTRLPLSFILFISSIMMRELFLNYRCPFHYFGICVDYCSQLYETVNQFETVNPVIEVL